MIIVSPLRVMGIMAGCSLLAMSCTSDSGPARPDGATGGSGGAGGTGAVAGGSGGVGGIGGTTDGSTFDGPTVGVDGGGTKLPIGTAACSNGRDDDGDNKIDYDDPECIGPLDNDESSFATGIPGDNSDACKQDCFFDGNSGAGDDGCDWQLKCDPASPGAGSGCPYDAQYAQSHQNECSTSSSQSQQCINYCQRLVPNGCDCFGCCFIPSLNVSLVLMASCTAADFNDPVKCPRCTQVTSCSNPCGTCEICIGKPTVPPECTGSGGVGGVSGAGGAGGTGGVGGVGGTSGRCPVGQIACGEGGIEPMACPAMPDGTPTGCVTGCCIPVIP